jgi:hypothetical protein
MTAEGRGKRLRVRDGLDTAVFRSGIAALISRLSVKRFSGRRRDIVVETIDGLPAGESRFAALLVESGFRAHPNGLRYYGRSGMQS